MQRRRVKPVVLVELLGALVQGMYKERSHASVLRDCDCAIDGVLQQGRAETLPLHVAIDCEPGKYHHRHGVGHVPTNTGGRELMRDGTRRHRVVSTDTSVVIDDDKGPDRTAGLIGQGPAFEPGIEFGFATVKGIQAVRCCQRLGWPKWQAQAFADFLPHGALTAISRSRPGL